MSEITKLYENAGVLKECLSPCYINKTWRKTHDCPNCDNRENYPPFTAEKVLKVIVFFLNKGIKLDFSVEENTKISVENFKECIAQIGARYWQSLTSEEKQQIKEILE